MALFTTCPQYPDKFGNSSRQTDPQLFFNHWWLFSEDRTLGLFIISTLHSSSFNMSVQQCVMCQLQKLNEPANTALALERNWFVSQLSIASKTAFDFCFPQASCLAQFQLLFSVYSSETCLISWEIYPKIFFI